MAQTTVLKPKVPIPTIPLSYDTTNPLPSIHKVIQALLPHWGQDDAKVEIVRLTGGVNNTLYKAQNKESSSSKYDLESQAVLIRAYGNSTEVLVDRERELSCHHLLQEHRLAPPIIGRFANGYVYGFVPGTVCSPADLNREPVWRGVARRIAEWHALLPVEESGLQERGPNLWSVLDKWISALPAETEEDKARQTTFMAESKFLKGKFANTKLVFSHCDLLGGNIVIKPRNKEKSDPKVVEEVDFIDFEYAMPTPAAFDIACHFSEWVGFDCDYNLLPTQSVRKAFLAEYVHAYNEHFQSDKDKILDLDSLCKEVDSFRGFPGLFWGIAALLQAGISKIDFDFKEYADLRIAEYWDWRAEEDGSRANAGKEMPLRERRWSQKE